MSGTSSRTRRGLPRTAGGAPWPLATTDDSTAPAALDASTPADGSKEGEPIRRGLPRLPGGAPWPPQRTVRSTTRRRADAVVGAPPGGAAQERGPDSDPEIPAGSPLEPTGSRRFGRYTLRQWMGSAAVVVVALGLLVAGGVAAARWLIADPAVTEFLAAYPGHSTLPESAPVGFPAWVNWQHFFNAFLIVLVVRSGLTHRHEKRAPAVWTSRRSGRKISLTLWLHQSLDLVWVANGLVYLVLLFVSGRWLRFVPTSWDVVPNAFSALLQYASLDWPTENGWVHYNALQQLAYFFTIFVAAPLAIATGARMSTLWPQTAVRLNRLYPAEWARRLHFPVMVYFVVFVIGHVALVFSTGALRNLNHMYVGQDAENWEGLLIFTGSVVLIAAGWVASRPLVIAPVARLFGTVTAR